MALAIQYSPSLFERSYAARPWQPSASRRLAAAFPEAFPAALQVRAPIAPIRPCAHRPHRRAAAARVSGLPRLVRDVLILALLVAPYLL